MFLLRPVTTLARTEYIFETGLHFDLIYTPAKFQDCIDRNVGQGE